MVYVRTLDDAPVPSGFMAGARAWQELGFSVSTVDAGLPHCPALWSMLHDTDCQISIGVYAIGGLVALAGTEAMADRATRIISYDRSVPTDRLSIIGAHEVGHILLNTPRHTRGGVMGGAASVLRDQDRALACEAARLCHRAARGD